MINAMEIIGLLESKLKSNKTNTYSRKISYQWKIGNNWQIFSVIADKELSKIEDKSELEFITEHYWGYMIVNNSQDCSY